MDILVYSRQRYMIKENTVSRIVTAIIVNWKGVVGKSATVSHLVAIACSVTAFIVAGGWDERFIHTAGVKEIL